MAVAFENVGHDAFVQLVAFQKRKTFPADVAIRVNQQHRGIPVTPTAFLVRPCVSMATA